MYVPYDRYGGVRGRGGEGRGEERRELGGGTNERRFGVSYFLIFDFFSLFFFVSRHHFFLLSVTSIMSSSRFDVASFVHSSGT